MEKEIALTLGKEGAFVVVNYNGSKERAEDVVREIKENGGDAVAIGCDVSNFAQCETFINNVISEYKRVDILINNAGITRDGLLMKMSEEDFDAVLDTNLKGAFHCMKFVSRQMLKHVVDELLVFLLYQVS